MQTHHLAFALLLPLSALPAQLQRAVAPAGHANLDGITQNTIPFWSASATYQQVHDQSDLAVVLNNTPTTIKGLSLRKDGSTIQAASQARTMDVQITLGVTPVDSQTATATYATNLGPSPTVVLPWTNISMPAMTNISLPNPFQVVIPFATPLLYPPAAGNNLCWELRLRNNSNTAAVYIDSTAFQVGLMANFGVGCTATGGSAAAKIGIRTLQITQNPAPYRNRLENALPSTPAVFLFGLQRQQIVLPLCSNLEIVPLIDIAGATNNLGQWDLTLPLPPFQNTPAAELVAQFAFLDAGLQNGIGLSDASAIRTPPSSSTKLTRLYTSTSGSATGNENSTTAATISRNYGFIIGIDY